MMAKKKKRSALIPQIFLVVGVICALGLFAVSIATIFLPPKSLNEVLARTLLLVILGTLTLLTLGSRILRGWRGGGAGAQGFCYISLDGSRHNTSGQYPLKMTSLSAIHDLDYWISPASANLDSKDPQYFSIDRAKKAIPRQPRGTRTWKGHLWPGDWLIEFDATNGLRHWTQRLTVAIEGGDLKQTVELKTLDGRLIYKRSLP